MKVGDTGWEIQVNERNGHVWLDLVHPSKGGGVFGASPDTVRGQVLRELGKDIKAAEAAGE